MNDTPLFLHFPTLPPERTAQQKGAFVRGGRVRFFTKPAVRREHDNMVALVAAKLPADWEPYSGPVAVRIHLCYPFRRSERTRVVADGLEIPHDRRPDLDNLCKGLIDALTTAQIWRDDGQISDLDVSKVWGPTGYWEVEVTPLDFLIPARLPPRCPTTRGGPQGMQRHGRTGNGVPTGNLAALPGLSAACG